MKNYVKHLIPVLFLGLIVTYNQSCCRGDCDDEPIDTVTYDTLFQNDTFLSYWFFPEGSWWVYKRTDTNVVAYDTARVTLSELRQELHPSGKVLSMYMMHITHSNWKVMWMYGVSNRTRDTINDKKPIQICSTDYLDVAHFSGEVGCAESLIWPLKYDQSPYGFTDSMTLKLYDGSIKKSVILKSKSGTEMHLVPDYGMVKYVSGANGSVWELVNKNN